MCLAAIRRIFVLSILLGACYFSVPFLLFAETAEKPNVVLIILDAVRADHLGCYGYNRDTSPNIDEFAKEGVLFTQALAQGSCTSISISSIFTSFFPEVLKIPMKAAYLPDKFTTLSEVLYRNGYITAAFGDTVIERISNLEQGFKMYYTTSRDINLEIKKTGPKRRSLYRSLLEKRMNKKVFAWLAENHQSSFFLYIHYLGAHDPYQPPPPYNTMFWHEDITDETKEFVAQFSRSLQGEHRNPLKDDLLGFIISQYDGEIRRTDGHVGVLLKELEKLRVLKNTLVIIAADHGEGFFEHGRFFHGNSLHAELIHVPFMMRLPRSLPSGKKITALVRLVDIMPTVLDILGIQSDGIMQGVSLLPLIKDEDMLKLDSFSEAHRGFLKGIRTDKWAFITSFNSRNEPYAFELYDLETDPEEKYNLADKRPREIEMFKNRLTNYIDQSKTIRGSVLGEGFVDKTVVLDEETKEALRSLGYLQ